MDVYQCTQSLDSKILKNLFRFEREFEFDDNSMIVVYVDNMNRIKIRIREKIFHAIWKERNPLKLCDVDVASDRLIKGILSKSLK